VGVAESPFVVTSIFPICRSTYSGQSLFVSQSAMARGRDGEVRDDGHKGAVKSSILSKAELFQGFFPLIRIINGAMLV